MRKLCSNHDAPHPDPPTLIFIITTATTTNIITIVVIIIIVVISIIIIVIIFLANLGSSIGSSSWFSLNLVMSSRKRPASCGGVCKRPAHQVENSSQQGTLAASSAILPGEKQDVSVEGFGDSHDVVAPLVKAFHNPKACGFERDVSVPLPGTSRDSNCEHMVITTPQSSITRQAPETCRIGEWRPDGLCWSCVSGGFGQASSPAQTALKFGDVAPNARASTARWSLLGAHVAA
eukprot:9699619-Karenia_brevis.AAC.1